MEVEEIQTQGHKFRRIRNGDGRIEQNKKGEEQFGDEEEDDEIKRRINGGSGGGGGLDFSSGGRLYGWPSSRIVRVSRASGGKDRHSKVLTSKGLRDRRVRLSVNTAIQFYDLQDRLGYDQPSKAVEWLLKAAASSISELPPISALLPDSSKQVSDEKSFDSPQVEMEIDPNCLTQQQQQQQQAALPKSACSSNSENSKGSGTLSLSRSESRIKARERARERAKAAEKEKDKENESATTLVFQQHEQLSQNLNPPISQNAASFTELLTSGMNGHHNNSNSNSNHNNSTTSPTGSVGEANFFHKSPRQYSTPMDYFATGLLGPASSTRATHGFSGQLHLGSPLQQALTTVSSPLFTFNGDQHHHHHHHQELPQFSFVQDHFIPVVTTAAAGNNGGSSNNNNNNNNSNNNEYNLNFTISSSSSSGLAGFTRGTLQSNSSTPSLLPHIQRFASIDGSPSTFFIGAAAPQPNAAVPPVENHHPHLIPGFDAGLQLCYRDGGRHSDQKGKGKS